ncbi:MAG TPA: hypothetical protein H9912_08420, partial [Candidatus Eisenbergiella stercorigallinarum]|nr:hypothetical protein [Candidatus Eisenbergiella stercorigallinarum]
MDRIRYRAARILMIFFLTAAGCGSGEAAEPAAAQAMDPEAFEIVSRDFSHSGYADSIAFLLPSG